MDIKRAPLGISAGSAGASGSVGRGKMSMYRQQLMEARLKEDEEMEDRRALENLVKQLQSELEERDQVISSLKDDIMSVASFTTATSPFVMSPDGGRSPDSRTPPQLSSSLGSAASFSLKDFSEKDNKILELNEKNIMLQRQVMDLEENLREKDEVIRARTQAVTLTSAALSAKGKSTLDLLEETRKAMKEMQLKFTEQEAEWKESNSNLEIQLEFAKKRLAAAESSLERAEKARFDMVTKNAAQQEKMVALQSKVVEARGESRKEVSKKEDELKSLLEKVDHLENQVERAKSVNEDRRNDFLEEIKRCVNDDEIVDRVREMDDKIVELEEEKGNLQLKLVETEETYHIETKAKAELDEVSEKLKRQDVLLESHLASVRNLEDEKLDLLEGK